MHIGKECRLAEPAGFEAIRLAGAADSKFRPFFYADIDHRLHAIILDLVEQRAEMITLLRRITNGGCLRCTGRDLYDLIIARALDQKPCWCIARLARVEHAFGH